ncbi:hypothetical protein DRH29_01845 [candidate division Kazan bacterium]|uniref:Bacterial Ig-like domain-containing protein n=1 Tax=candidate division Kazan bacterium TaxID=2202143 RepID=A0A420ZD98_UNCK3|nr:MAG: hypothetical protein DRH29_01845 [candidate division Kazan bacterium]
MAQTKSPQANRHRILYIALGIIGLIILIGSTVAVAQTGVSLQTLKNSISQLAAHLGGSDLLVQVEHSQLPADGKSQSKIWVTPINTSSPLTANIIRGDGRVELLEHKDNNIQFIYTAGSNPGKSVIVFTSGILRQTTTIELIQSEVPPAPTITSPPDKSQINNSKPEIIGAGAQNTKIIITDNGKHNTITKTDEHGHFQTHLDKPLYNGQHTLAAIAINDLGIESATSNLVTITIKTDPAGIDRANIRIIPARVVAGESFAIFVPASLNAAKVTVEMAGQTYELFDFNKTSVFVATLPAPTEPGIYVGDVIVADVSGNISRFDNTISITVIS